MPDATVHLSIVSPVHNEAGGLRALVEQLQLVASPVCDQLEIILVDDGSSDASWAAIVALSDELPPVKGLRFSRNFGKEAAMRAGLEAASGDAVIVIDSDLQHPPSLIPLMVERWRDGAEVVEGVKTNRAGQRATNRLASTTFNRLFSRLTDIDLDDASDYRLLSRRAVDALLRLPERSFFRGTSTWIGFERAQLPFEVATRGDGRSKWSSRSLSRMALNAITSFTPAPLHLVTLGGVVFASFALILGVQTLVQFFRGDAIEGFTTVILVLLFMGTFVMLGLGVIGEYLARIHDEVKGRPHYLTAERAGFDDPS